MKQYEQSNVKKTRKHSSRMCTDRAVTRMSSDPDNEETLHTGTCKRHAMGVTQKEWNSIMFFLGIYSFSFPTSL